MEPLQQIVLDVTVENKVEKVPSRVGEAISRRKLVSYLETMLGGTAWIDVHDPASALGSN